MAARSKKQLSFVIRTHGGLRKGAGRKRVGDRPSVPHRDRGLHDPRHPAHVTFRAGALPASLRHQRVVCAIRGAIARASNDGFRVLHFSVQSNHVHLVVEADTALRFTRGLQGLAIRVAKAVNAVLGRRGRVWAERFHARWLTTPRAVRNALVYVLQNGAITGTGSAASIRARRGGGSPVGCRRRRPPSRRRWSWRGRGSRVGAGDAAG